MEPYVRRFIRSSVLWLSFGVLFGLGMAMDPYRMLPYKPAHVHANLLGFVSMMIFGVAYHVLPRFSGRALYSDRLARWHLVCANAGLALMVAGFIARVTWSTPGTVALAIGGTLSAAGALMFATNIWKTLEPASGMTPLGSIPPQRQGTKQ